MSLDIGVPGGTGAEPGFDVRRGAGGLSIGVGAVLGANAIFGIHRDTNAALINVFPVPPAAPGWTVYQFFRTVALGGESQFTLRSGATVTADTLIIGGGGTGGAARLAGGAGGGGEVLDLHQVQLLGGETDGELVVGAGGRGLTFEEVIAQGHGNNGEGSSFGGLTAIGGGAGGWGDRVYPQMTDPMGPALDGGSGGGASPWSSGLAPLLGDPPTEYDGSYGLGGQATNGEDTYTCNTLLPYAPGADSDLIAERKAEAPWGQSGYWEDGNGHKFWQVTRKRGHGGRDGKGYGAWYSIQAGGGGGAHEMWNPDNPGIAPWFWVDQGGYQQSAGPVHGGHGVPCDIAGRYQYGDVIPEVYEYLTALDWEAVPWFGGGGAGAEGKPWWSYPVGKPGYGGGGEVNQQGLDGTGGGGGGGGGAYPIEMPCQPGGDGSITIRIRTADERLVTYPIITGIDEEHLTNGLPSLTTEDGDPRVVVTRLPQSMAHSDTSSAEEPCPRTYEETH